MQEDYLTMKRWQKKGQEDYPTPVGSGVEYSTCSLLVFLFHLHSIVASLLAYFIPALFLYPLYMYM